MVILDEAQHIIDRDSTKILFSSTNWLKTFIEDTGIPMVLVGLPELKTVIKSNEQLRTRFDPKDNRLLPFNINGNVPHLSLSKFLSMVDMKLPFPNPSNLNDPSITEIIFLASSGVPRTFMEQIIIPCAIDAIDNNLTSIPHELIKRRAAEFCIDKELTTEHSKILKIKVGNKKSHKLGNAVNSSTS